MWYNFSDAGDVFRIFGYAGSGKSTCINTFIEAIQLDPKEQVRFATFTGKAALVLRRKGIAATTIHKLIYDTVYEPVTKKRPDGSEYTYIKTKFVKKTVLDHDNKIKLLVLDECSMISDQLWKDLQTFNKKIVVLGDPGQLPPIYGVSPITSVEPDVFLDEIMRQAKDNPIIHIATKARLGERIDYGWYGNNVYVGKRDCIQDQVIKSGDIVLTTKNDTRDRMNDYIRRNLRGITSPLPVVGEKLICRKNNWERSLKGFPLVNGMIGDVVNPVEVSKNGKRLLVDFRPEGFTKDYFEGLDCDIRLFDPNLSANERKEISGSIKLEGNAIEYGYSITTHLSQGSQWRNVVYYYEPFGDKEFRKKLLYTGVTRPEEFLYLYI